MNSNIYTPVSSATAAAKHRNKHRTTTTISRHTKMKKTFRQRIRDWLAEPDQLGSDIVQVESEGFSLDDSIRLDITPARGGIIINIRKYDRKTDRRCDIVHVIHDDENVSEQITQIISMELLKA